MSPADDPSPTAHARHERRARWPWGVAVFALTVTTASLAGSVAGGRTSLPTAVVHGLMLSASLGSGALLLSRRPDHAVSWLVPLPALYLGLDAVLGVDGQATSASDPWGIWAVQVSWAPSFLTIGIFLPLLFPTGALPSPRWRWLVLSGIGAVVLLTIGNALAPDLLRDIGLANPAAVHAPAVEVALVVGGGLMVVSFVSAVVAAVVRYRRATGPQRQQLRWFVRSAALVPVGWAAAAALDRGPYADVGTLALGVAISLLPIAVSVAVLRYRLYDIDRIVSRTVGYAIVTAVLAGVYAAVVLGAQLAVGTRGDVPDVVVALATLSAAGLFQPLRRRVQRAVDRRFARARYDAPHLVAGFAGRLRDQLDAEHVLRDLDDVVTRALAPVAVSVWLPHRPTSDGAA